MKDMHCEITDQLFEAILSLKTVEDCYLLFEDLCTIKELQDMSQRLETAKLLKAGENYETISKKLGISTTTISRVSRCLNYGSGGYENALKALEEKNNGNQ